MARDRHPLRKDRHHLPGLPPRRSHLHMVSPTMQAKQHGGKPRDTCAAWGRVRRVAGPRCPRRHGGGASVGTKDFAGSALRGMSTGSKATEQEMAWLAKSVVSGKRSCSSITFYD